MENLSQGEFWEIKNEQGLQFLMKHIKESYEKHGLVTVKCKAGKTRSTLQNNALHVYCRLLAEALNSAGYDMRKTLKEGIEVPWTTELVKQYLWKPVQEAVTGNDSTSVAGRSDFDETHAILSNHLHEKFKVYVPFPKR